MSSADRSVVIDGSPAGAPMFRRSAPAHTPNAACRVNPVSVAGHQTGGGVVLAPVPGASTAK